MDTPPSPDYTLFNLLADGVLVIDQEFTIVFANQAFGSIYGLAAQEVISRKCYEVSHNRLNPCDEQSLQGTLCCCAEIFGTARPMTQTHCHTMPDGTQKTFAITASPITDSVGEVAQVIQVLKEITECRQAERDLRFSNMVLKTQQETSQDGILVVDALGKMISLHKLAEKKMQALTMRLEEVQEVERHRLARELHDNVGQKLTALGINLQILSNEMQPEENSRFQPRLADSMKLVEDISEQTRSIMADLRPPVLDDYGIMAGLRWVGHKFANMVGLEVVVEGREPQPRLPPHKEITLYRIAQEALTNTVKHAQARSFHISLTVRGKSVRLRLTDDGKGFALDKGQGPGSAAGWGLMSMKERTEALNGRFALETAPGRGTKITVEVPL